MQYGGIEQPQPKGRRQHPQWAFQQADKDDWKAVGRPKRDERHLYNKKAPPVMPIQYQQPGVRRFDGYQDDGFTSRQTDPGSMKRSMPHDNANSRHRNKGGSFSNHSSPTRNKQHHGKFSPHASYDPLYQPPPKVPQVEHGRLATFFKNGDASARGLPVVINRSFASFGSLLMFLTREMGYNCQRIFQLPHGQEIGSLNDFEPHGLYVVSDRRPFDKSVNYGDLQHPVAGNLSVNRSQIGDDYYDDYADETSPAPYQYGSKKPEDVPLYRQYDPHDTLENYPVATIRLINNLNRQAHVEVSLSGNKKTFKMLLHEFGQFFGVRDCHIWTSRLPCKRVAGLGQLYAELERNPQFLVCGSEDTPTEASGVPYAADQQQQQASPRNVRLSRSFNGEHRPNNKADQAPRQSRQSMPPQINNNKDSPEQDDRLIRRNLAGRSISPSIVFSPQAAPSRTEGPTKANYVGTNNHQKNRSRNKYGSDQLRFSDGSDLDELPTGATSFSGDAMASMNEEPMSPVRGSRGFETYNRKNKRQQPAIKAPFMPQNSARRAVTKRQLLDEGKIKRRVGLRLEWVYGYRGKDSRENLFFLPSGELMYYVGIVAIIYEPVNEEQRHYKGHTEDINCMALHPDEPLVATGQIVPAFSDQQPHVRVWNYQSLNTVAIIGLGVFQASICCIGFSPDGNRLMVLDEADRHSLSVWRWSEDKQIAYTSENVDESGNFLRPTTSDTIVWGKFCPNDNALLITYGKEHLYFWKLSLAQSGNASGKLTRDVKSGVFNDSYPAPKYVTAAVFLTNGDLVTGDSSGSLLVWTRDGDETYTIHSAYSHALVNAHKKSVFAVVVTGPNHILTGGGLEVKSWELKDGKVVNTANQNILESSGFIRSLVVGKNSVIFAGTTKNCILEGALQGKFRYIVQGHGDEVWALSCHSKDSTFVTGGYDCQLIKWFAPIHRSVWRTPLEKQCLSVAFHPTEDVVAIGTSIGRLVVLNSYNGMHICSVQMAGSTDLLTCLQFAPEGDMIVCGSQDGPLYVSLVEDGGRTYRRHKAGIIESQLGAVQNVDWHDEVAELIQFSTRTGSHGFATIEDMKSVRVEASAVSDDWCTYTSPTGKLVRSVMNRLKPGEEVTACDMVSKKSPIHGLLAASTNYGRILLTAIRPDVEVDPKVNADLRRVPSADQQAVRRKDISIRNSFRTPLLPNKLHQLHESRMCSHNITALRFTSDGRYLIAVGGKDGIIYQYATNMTELWGGNATPNTQ